MNKPNTNLHTKGWVKVLFTFAKSSRWKMATSLLFSFLSVAGGFLPYLCLYQIMQMFIFQTPNVPDLTYWCLLAALGYFLHYLFFGISTALSHSAAYHILQEIRLTLANKLMKAPLGKVTGNEIGHLKTIMIENVEGIERPLAHMIPELGANAVLALTVFGYLFAIDWRMGLASMITLPVAAIPMMLTNKGFEEKYAAYLRANDHVNSIIVEYVSGIEVVKTFNQSSTSYERFTKAVLDYRDFVLAWFRSSWKGMNLILSILPTTFLGTLPVGLLLYKMGALTPVELIVCLVLALSLLPVLMKTTTFIVEMKSMKYNVAGVKELLDLEELPDAGDSSNPAINHVRGSATNPAFNPASFDITFENVRFSYLVDSAGTAEQTAEHTAEQTAEHTTDVLHGIDLCFKEGTFNAIVGPSGSGKSTIAKLIARFWDVSEGSIRIGGTNIKDILLRQLSAYISFVTQDNFLFECSLKENIRLGKPSATDEEVYAAAKAACCDDFIRRLENGYDTSAGEAGKKLSGGEKQRISIARSILKNAPIVILDEATAFTDPQNEEQIQTSISALSKGKTLIVIAHRLSTIQNADQIVLLENGRVSAIGTQEELLKRSALYQSMWQAHIGAKQWGVKQA